MEDTQQKKASTTVFTLPILERMGLILATGIVGFCLLRGFLTFKNIYKTIGKRDTDAKRLLPILQGKKKLTQCQIPKKTIR